MNQVDTPPLSTQPLPKRVEVAVIGAGPAGCMAAFHLARAGRDVVLFERASLPRYKTCGGGLVGRSLRVLSDVPNIELTFERTFHSAAMRIQGNSKTYAVKDTKPVVVMTMRDRFDAHLAQAANDAGATVCAPCRVEGVQRVSHGVDLQTSHGSCHVAFVVVADGALSSTAEQLGFADQSTLIPAVEYELEVAEDEFRAFSNEARFDFAVVPHGYAWVFPKRNHLSAGILSVKRGPYPLKRLFSEYLEFVGIRQIRHRESHGHLIPIAPRPGALAHDRALLVGDAAGLADPITCEGISYALLSGRLAATAILQTKQSPELHYQQQLQTEVLAELKAARLVARILYGPPRLRNFLFRAKGDGLARAIAKVMAGETSFLKELRAPTNYWRLLQRSRSA